MGKVVAAPLLQFACLCSIARRKLDKCAGRFTPFFVWHGYYRSHFNCGVALQRLFDLD